jgi:hypothetical protein
MKRGPAIVLASILAIGLVVGLWKYLSAAPAGATSVAANPSAPEPAPRSSEHRALATDAPETAVQATDASRVPEGSDDAEDVLLAEVEVRGRVLDSARPGHGVANARIRFEQDGNVTTAASGLSGSYEIERLKTGTWTLSIDASGYRPWSEAKTIRGNLSPAQFSPILDPVNRVWVQFRTPDGQDLGVVAKRASGSPGQVVITQQVFITLAATTEAPSNRIAAARDGMWDAPYYTVQGLREGQSPGSYDRYFDFPEPLPMYLSACLADVVLGTQYVGTDQPVVTFVLSLASLHERLHAVRLRVLDADSGEPVRSATAGLLPLGMLSVRGLPVDVDGRIVFEQRPPGRWTLLIEARDYERVLTPVEIASDEDTDLGTFKLSRGISIEGMFIDLRGAPVTGISFELVPVHGFDASTDTRTRLVWVADEHGGFSVKQIDRGQHVIRRVWRGVPKRLHGAQDGELGFRPILVDTSDGSKAGILVQCAPAMPVAFRGDDGSAEAITIVDEHDLPVEETHIGASAIHLVPGAYVAKLMKHGAVSRSAQFQVGVQTDTQRVDLRQ